MFWEDRHSHTLLVGLKGTTSLEGLLAIFTKCILNFWHFTSLVGEKWHLNIILIFIFLIMRESVYLFIDLRVISGKKIKRTQHK